MAAFQHWRLRFLPKISGQYTELAELQFLDASGVNQSIGGTAFASTEFSASYTADKAFDGNNATQWSTVNLDTNPSIGYSHSSPVDIAGLLVVWPFSSGSLPLGGVFTIEGAASLAGPWTVYLPTGAGIGSGATKFYGLVDAYGLQLFDELTLGVEFQPVSYGLEAPADQLVLTDLQHGGRGRIYGNTYTLSGSTNLPKQCLVRLFRDVDSMALRQVWSDPDGSFEFADLNESLRYSVVAFHPASDYRAVIADNLLPEVAP